MSGWKHEFVFNGKTKDTSELEAYTWCKEQFGPIDWSTSSGSWRWAFVGSYTVKFRNTDDFILFKLRWQGIV